MAGTSVVMIGFSQNTIRIMHDRGVDRHDSSGFAANAFDIVVVQYDLDLKPRNGLPLPRPSRW